MATTKFKIDRYQLRLLGTDNVGQEWNWATKVIELFSDKLHVGTAYFVAPGREVPEDSFTLNQILFNGREEQYAHVIDVLRNEFPVFMCWDPKSDIKEQNDGIAYFETAREKVGEGDVSQPRTAASPISRKVDSR